MPRYFFHVMDGRIAIDKDGLEFPGDPEARHQALIAASEMILDREVELWIGNVWQMIVAKEDGSILCVLRFSAGQPRQCQGQDGMKTISN